MKFFNDASGGGMPTTPSNGKIQGPGATRFVTDAGAPEIAARLPRSARDRLRALRRRHDDCRDLMHTLTDRLISAQRDRAHAAAVAQERRQHVSRPITAAAREHAASELQRAERKLRECDEAIAELQQRAEATKAIRAPIASVLRQADEALLALPPGARLKDCTVEPKLRKGEVLADVVARIHEEIARLDARRASVETAPLPLQEALPLALQQLDQLAARGLPNVWRLLEIGAPLEFATTLVRVDLSTGFAMPAGDQVGHQIAGAGHGEVTDAAALVAWLFRDQMAKKIEAELRACCSDTETMTRQERAKRLAEIDDQRLTLEREEVACIEADDFRIAFRSDCDWRAALGVIVE